MKKLLCLLWTVVIVASNMSYADAADYTDTANGGFKINSSTNNEPYWYRALEEKHYIDNEYVAYTAYVTLGYSAHKG